MGGVPDDVDYGNTLSLFSLLTLCVLFLYYILLGNWLDLVFGLTFIALANGAVVTPWLHELAVIWPWFGSGLVALAGWLLFKHGRSRLTPNEAVTWHGLGRPYLVPCRTTHTRLFPQKHSFSYSYLVAGVPVGYTGTVNGLVSVDQGGSRGKGWYHVDAADCLQRGHGDLGLRGKLDNYLKTQDVEPSNYPHAYLITAARFLGHHFNPVSFWYLYSSDKVLSAIILEVNNTFGERRPYIVLRDFAEEAQRIPDTTPAPPGMRPSRIKGCWPKDFHVSPFNSRKGSYSLIANDPLGANMEGFRGLDVTINLRSSKGHAKLVARLFSEGEAADPSTMSGAQKISFLLKWHWVGFVTFPRIVREAAVLFFKRRLHVWYRPEPLKESWGRHADGIERDLEGVFREHLQHLVAKCRKPMWVKYVPCGVTDLADEVYTSSAAATAAPGAVEQVEMRVLTPVFYSHLVHYAHDLEGILGELTDKGTIWVDKPHALSALFLGKGPAALHTSSLADFAGFELIRKLRRRRGRMAQASTSAEGAADLGDSGISPMDAYVLERNNGQRTAVYRAAVLRLLVADHLCWGSVALLRVVECAWHAGLGWLLAWALARPACGPTGG